jgi:hypothetical protein
VEVLRDGSTGAGEDRKIVRNMIRRGEKRVAELMVVVPALATAFNGLLAGLNVDTALVKLPTRRRIGVQAYATFARGNDLGNGRVVYPLLGVGAALLTIVATLLAFAEQAPTAVLLPLFLATVLSLLHTVATTRAAPVMLSLKTAPDVEAVLSAKLDRFARWHALRALFQVLAFFALLWALVVA